MSTWGYTAETWNTTDRCAIVIVNQSEETMRTGWRVLWRWVSVADAIRICSDPRTAGPSHFLAWVREPDLGNWYEVRDDGRYDHVLADLGVALLPGDDEAGTAERPAAQLPLFAEEAA